MNNIKIKTIGQLLDYVETVEKAEELIDYINNLQEETNKLTAESTEWESKFYDLQEKCENYRKLKERYQIEKELYKSRNEKAIEYIKNFNYYIPEDNKEELIKILESEVNYEIL